MTSRQMEFIKNSKWTQSKYTREMPPCVCVAVHAECVDRAPYAQRHPGPPGSVGK